MSKDFRRGLVVGKFCPLHRGHELLIRSARAQCDELVVLSYTKPGFAAYDRQRRADWLKARFADLDCHVLDDEELARRCEAQRLAPRQLPRDDAPADEHRHFVAWLLLHLLGGPVDAVFTSEDYGDGFAAVLAGTFALPVRHVCVDRGRRQVPVSGTQVRRDPMAFRALLSDEVYADLVPRVAILGGESTGKTTLAAALADALGTAWAPEFGRELWDQRGGKLAFGDMEFIGRTQIRREQQQALNAHGVLVCDTTPLTTMLYSEWLFGRAAAELSALARRPYQLTLLCEDDFTFVQDGTRQDASFRAKQQTRYRQELQQRAIPFHALSGPLPQRIGQALAFVDALCRVPDTGRALA